MEIHYKLELDLLEAKQMNISGVPYFLFNNKYSVSGAQPSDVFLDVLKKTYVEMEISSSSDDNVHFCTPDGCGH